MTAADWLKFLPGWFAAVVAAWTLLDKWQTRRHRRALGPDDAALRTDLTTLRRLFKEIQKEERREDWFMAEERRDLDQRLMDHSSRRTDPILTQRVYMTGVAWRTTEIYTPSALGPRVGWMDHETTPEERTRSEKDQAEFRQQRAAAAQGLQFIDEALKRLNELEQRTFGRS
jgi:hypothetical protein